MAQIANGFECHTTPGPDTIVNDGPTYNHDNDPERKYLIGPRIKIGNSDIENKLIRDSILAPVEQNKFNDGVWSFCEWFAMENHGFDNFTEMAESSKVHIERMSFETRRRILMPPVKKPLDWPEPLLVIVTGHEHQPSPIIRAERFIDTETPITALLDETSPNLHSKAPFHFTNGHSDYPIFNKTRRNSGIQYALRAAAFGKEPIVNMDTIPYSHVKINTHAQMTSRIFEVDGQDVSIPLHLTWKKSTPAAVDVESTKWDRWVTEYPEQTAIRQRARELYHQERQEVSRYRAIAEAQKYQADAKARRILFDHLNELQQESWLTNKFFYARINDKAWKFEYGTHGNVHLMDTISGRSIERFCIAPVSPYNGGQLPVDDVVLAQMLLIQADEAEFRRIANITRYRYSAFGNIVETDDIFDQLMTELDRLAA